MGKGKTHEEASAEGSDASIKVGPDGIIPGLDIPTVWQGHGVGNGGQDPPPWAIIPYGLGKPSLCFMEPDKGYCAERKTRWGYNSYMADCRKFLYTGCGGNGNNFMTRKRCEESCVDERVSNCQKYGEYMEY
ncbi:tissue factor pathway inhibitor-like isoform X2 [Trichoplusia ni]|nr:tissue factor pathway inhibitor-like isoform X2 [Trichoplusia ni]XP_026743636.1 tissue factor pathway inhibitor-like isoform X2 [Trichoplusia ni]XP_026743637.1 tissue factor pathway inhibitor-like isoform X2 [Trichoplusia ni]XP_026743638.1 tissue factor pathway inhibitor-like isoform X2 [Trichoplusia ni]XP_026743639.1 tissue factor pathway inhibitor-like isoform X2 [Trichoplusia ni]